MEYRASKNGSLPVTDLWNMGLLQVSKDSKLILMCLIDLLDNFRSILEAGCFLGDSFWNISFNSGTINDELTKPFIGPYSSLGVSDMSHKHFLACQNLTLALRD